MKHSIRSFIRTLLSAALVAILAGCAGDNTGGSGSTSGEPAPSRFTVHASSGTEGSITPVLQTVAANNTASFTVSAGSGYKISNVTGCSGTLSGNIYTTAGITATCDVNAMFNINNYVIDATAGLNGSISPDSSTVNHGASTSFSIAADNGYTISSITGCDGTLSGSTYITGAITSNCAVSATFALTNLSVSTSTSSGGSINPANATLSAGETTTFTVTAENNYDISSVSGCDGTLSGSTYTTGAITADCAVSAIFTPTVLSVSTSISSGGSINPTSMTLSAGETTTFIVTAENDYDISSVSGCDGTLTGNSYVTSSVYNSCTVIAIFNSTVPVEAKSFIQAIEAGEADPVMVNGQAWTFRTPPPPVNERKVRTDHPRLLLTPDNLPEIKVKLNDPVYNYYMQLITSRADSGSMLENAFLYQITGDLTRADKAKQTLLNYSGDYGEGIIFGYDAATDKLGPVLVFDWIMDTLTTAEKIQIFANVKDNFNYDHTTADPVKHGANGLGTYPWYWNDVYNRHIEIMYPSLAFVIAGDGIDDAWANEVIEWAYDENETRVVGPYGANKGSGFLDVLMTMSLDTGGMSDAGSGYYNYWLGAVHAIAFWESATGQEMWSRAPFLEKGPQALLTSRDGINPQTRIRSALEFISGVSTGDTAALARYTVDHFGAATYQTVYQSIFGDLRIEAKTPTELNIPTAKYVRGDHTFYSKNSWADDAVSLYVRSPYINVGRYVGNDGIFALYKGTTPIAIRGVITKTAPDSGLHSGMWIYDPANIDPGYYSPNKPLQNKGNYWNGNRSYDAWTTVSQSKYFEGGPKSVEVNDTFRAISMEYGKRYDKIDVGTAQRTIVHIPDVNRDFIVIYDFIDVASNLKSAWSMRLVEEPSINGSEFSLLGIMNATVVAPENHTLEWLGGFNKEFVTPSPEQAWYSNSKGGSVPGYSVDRPDYINGMGLGNIYIQPPGQQTNSSGPFVQQSEYLVVIEVSEMTPVSVTRISDREVEFDQWRVKFSVDGTYTVTNL